MSAGSTHTLPIVLFVVAVYNSPVKMEMYLVVLMGKILKSKFRQRLNVYHAMGWKVGEDL
jgi:hypothetical protein